MDERKYEEERLTLQELKKLYKKGERKIWVETFNFMTGATLQYDKGQIVATMGCGRIILGFYEEDYGNFWAAHRCK